MRNHYQGVWVCSIQGPVLTTTSVWGCSNTAPAGILNTHEELARATKYYQSNGEWWKYNHLSCSLCLRRPLSSSYKPLVFSYSVHFSAHQTSLCSFSVLSLLHFDSLRPGWNKYKIVARLSNMFNCSPSTMKKSICLEACHDSFWFCSISKLPWS